MIFALTVTALLLGCLLESQLLRLTSQNIQFSFVGLTRQSVQMSNVSSWYVCAVECALFYTLIYSVYALPLLLCAGKNLELQPRSVCVPHGPGYQTQHLESSQGRNVSIIN